MPNLKSKAHTIVALVDAGLNEQRATYLVGKAYSKDGDPDTYFKSHQEALSAELKQVQTEHHAIKTLLDGGRIAVIGDNTVDN